MSLQKKLKELQFDIRKKVCRNEIGVCVSYMELNVYSDLVCN